MYILIIKQTLGGDITYISTRSTWTPHGSVPSSNTCYTYTSSTNVPAFTQNAQNNREWNYISTL